MTEHDVLRQLCGYERCLWHPRKVMAMTNVHNIALRGHESDLLLLTPAGWLWEVEVKCSAADFRREFSSKKLKHAVLRGERVVQRNKVLTSPLQRWWLAMPSELYEQVKDEIPSYAGVIVVAPRIGRLSPRPTVVRRAPILPGARKDDGRARSKMLEASYYRFWLGRLFSEGPLDKIPLDTE